MLLSETQVNNIAKELTIKAIENNLIIKYDNSIDTAKEVVEFYQEIKSTINGANNNQ